MEKDIRYTQKKVDDGWKDQIAKEKGDAPRQQPSPEKNVPPSEKQIPHSQLFFNFLTSLGYQAMIHLGEVPNPETQQPEGNLHAAKEIIDLLVEIEKKTNGNLSAQEADFFQTVLPQIQLKFTQKV